MSLRNEMLKPVLDQKLDKLLAARKDALSFSEGEYRGLTLYSAITQSEIEKKYEVPPRKTVIGVSNGLVLFSKETFTRWSLSLEENDDDEYEVGTFNKSDEISVTWLMSQEGLANQLITYNHSYAKLHHDGYQNDNLAVGYNNYYQDAYYQVALYKPEGTFKIHSYCGKDSRERRNYSTIKPIPLYSQDSINAPWLNLETQREEERITIRETLKENLVHELVFPTYINTKEWKDILFDPDDTITSDPTLPWMHWFRDLGIRITTSFPPNLNN